MRGSGEVDRGGYHKGHLIYSSLALDIAYVIYRLSFRNCYSSCLRVDLLYTHLFQFRIHFVKVIKELCM